MQDILRVVTGHDASGKAVVMSKGSLPTVIEVSAIPGTVFHEVWNTAATPVRITATEAEPTLGPLKLPPPPQGTRIRFVDIPPDTEEFLRHGHERVRQAFTQVGDTHASTAQASSPHPLMHRTESVDYGVVMEGEIVLVLDDSEVPLKRGDVVIQRGTNHAWANRGSRPARVAFVLVDAVPLGIGKPVMGSASAR
jgi:naringenin degradation protein FdeH